MNKTAILSFIIDEVALKCRNVSTNMRKRIHYILKCKKITVRKYDVRVLILNGWVRVGKQWAYISKLEEMKKGVSNYYLETQEQVDRLLALNNEVRCYTIDFIPTAPIEVESIENFTINHQDKYEISSKSSFNRVKYLGVYGLSTDQIKFILKRCKRIDELKISDCSLEKLDLSQSRIKEFYFNSVSFKEPIYLPKEIEQLELIKCASPNLIKTQKVNRISFNDYTDDPKKHIELTKTLKGVKVAEISYSLKQCFTYLPSTIRKIDGLRGKIDNLKGVINQFPYLIEITPPFPIQPTDKSKLRVIWPIFEETQEKFNLRPRKIRVDNKNAHQLNNHPELFEKVERVYINTNKFNFDVLPSEIKKIQIWSQVDLESVTLNRLEKEPG